MRNRPGINTSSTRIHMLRFVAPNLEDLRVGLFDSLKLNKVGGVVIEEIHLATRNQRAIYA